MRWLTHSCENPKDGKYKWKQMIEFLEKEITVQQHKTVIETNLNMSNLGKDNRDGRNKGDKGKSTYHSQTPNNRPSQDPICFICGANDHVQTNGPNNTKLVQYHSCKQFVDMTTSQRLKFLNDNGLCHQCLYPGAQISRGKHSEGKCQYKFICQHPSHASDVVKKHVLVCDQHKFEQVNKDVLEHYKDICIRKQP